MLLPKKVLHRKWHKGRRRSLGVATRANFVAFGEFGIKSQEHGWISSRQIEAARRVLTRYVSKGSQDHYVAVIKPGTVMFEMGGVPEETAKEAIRMAAFKIGVKTKFVT